MNQYLLAFLTGLTTGGISCFAVQGGLLASISTKKRDIILFLTAKIISYTILGFFLGFIGQMFQIPIFVTGVIQVLIGILMILVSLKKYYITAPKDFFRILKNQKTPIFLGFLTILIPCGVTQVMMLTAISSGNALNGALIMLFFILGTSPLFFILGVSANKIMENKYLSIIGTLAIFILGIISIKNGLTLMGYNFSKTGLEKAGTVINIIIDSNGYKSDVNTLKIGVPVKLNIITKNEYGCGRALVIPDLNYSKILPINGTETIEFTPTKLGNLTYTCSMGMYSGSFTVIE
jgi:sulfite exporter TauE/SafE